MKKLFVPLVLGLLSMGIFISCGDDDDSSNGPVIPANVNNNRNTSGPAETQSRLEFPKLNSNGNSSVIVHNSELNYKTGETGVNYCTEWDNGIRAQRWSCYQLYASINYNQSENVKRYDTGVPTPEIPSPTGQYPNDPDCTVFQFSKDPYKYNGFDHGHICPSADRQRSTKCNYQTFYLTNMQPQYNKFNAGLWEKMEQMVRTWADWSDTLYVCKGGTIDKSEDILKYIGKDDYKIPVPKYFFTAVLSKTATGYKAIALFAENLDEDKSKDKIKNYIMSVRELENRTGIDFFCNLPDQIEEAVENVDIQEQASRWGL